jgi:hypothetical protein
MNHLKKFEGFFKSNSHVDIKVSEADKIKSLPGFNLFRTYSSVYGYCIIGRRSELPKEDIIISKTIDDEFELKIRRSPGYFKDMIPAGIKGWEEDWNREDRTWEFNYKFDNIEELKNFLLKYKWYDLTTNY